MALHRSHERSPDRRGKRVRLCANDDYLWERVGETARAAGLHEAPQVLQRDGRTFVVYSCSASWQPTYKLGLLALRPGGDPLNPSDWTKHPKPVFQSNFTTFGVGHNCFVKSPDGTEDWILYHAKMDRRTAGGARSIAQPFRWTREGLAGFWRPCSPLRSMLSALRSRPGPHTRTVGAPLWLAQADLEAFNYFGHHQFMQLKDGRLHLGIVPAEPVNDFRSGEKVVLANRYWRDLACSVRVKVIDGARDAGLALSLHPARCRV